MRVIVYGVGAIGGTVAAGLALAGREVIGIARGAMLDAVRDRGLLLRTRDRETVARFPCHADLSEVAVRPDDVVVLAVKSQDTEAALLRLREAGVSGQPIACAQNGVANERLALRFFPNVYGVNVMMPADYSVPGEVSVFSRPRYGIFDIGRYPAGSDGAAESIAATLEVGNIAAFVQSGVMAHKYGKLLLNLDNVLEAALGVDADRDAVYRLARIEAEEVYTAAGISWIEVGNADPRRRDLMQVGGISGMDRKGGSSTQSLRRGTGSIETDYLNGEIVLLGRLHGVPVPVNAFLCGVGRRMAEEQMKPGDFGPDALLAGLRAVGVAV